MSYASAYLLVFLSTAVLAVTNATSVYMTNPTTTKLVEFWNSKPTGLVHTDRDTKDFFQLVLNAMTFLYELLEGLFTNSLVYPGTLWCGAGKKATNYSQLGKLEAEDKCCREHDNCPNYFLAEECRDGFCNNSSFTSSHCECDMKFRECLINANTSDAYVIRFIFDKCGAKCFTETDCKETEKIKLENEEGTICPYKLMTLNEYNPSDEVLSGELFVSSLNILLERILLQRLHVTKKK